MSIVDLKSNFSEYNSSWWKKTKQKKDAEKNRNVSNRVNRSFSKSSPIDDLISAIPNINRDFHKTGKTLSSNLLKNNTEYQRQIPRNIAKFQTETALKDVFIRKSTKDIDGSFKTPKLENMGVLEINKESKATGNVTIKNVNVDDFKNGGILEQKKTIEIVKPKSESNKESQYEVIFPKEINLTSNFEKNETQLEGRHNNSNIEINPTEKSGRHTEGRETNNFETPSIENQSSFESNETEKSGRHTEGKDVSNNSPLDGRHEQSFVEIIKGEITLGKESPVEVGNNSPLDGRHEQSNYDANQTQLSGRHTEGKDVSNQSAISGRHTEGKDVSNQSKLSGRHIVDTSIFNIDGSPSGVNFFNDTNANGFTIRQKNTDFKTQTSIFGWDGNKNDAPTVNYFSDSNFSGFHKFASLYDTFLVNQVSIYGFEGQAPEVNYFTNTYNSGFTSNAQLYETEFIPDASIYVWSGGKENAPSVNYFTNIHNTGFSKFAQLYETEFKRDTSIFVWSGGKENAPTTDFFVNTNVTEGFHKFHQLYDTKYLTQSSIYVWEGGKNNAPTTNFFVNTNVTEGFHKFHQLYDTKYLTQSSIFVWSGGKENAPTTDFFVNTNVTEGFHKFHQLYDTKYLTQSSIYVWEGGKNNAPTTNYFENIYNTGFSKFAQLYETEFIPDTSIFVWKGSKENAPSTNYFTDIHNTGFNKFAQLYETDFKRDTSIYVWKGSKENAPSTNFFKDFNNTGFTTFPDLFVTEFRNDSSRFGWKGSKENAPSTNYFTDTHNTGFTTFSKRNETEFKRDTSIYVWKGNKYNAPSTDFFANINSNGFTNFATETEFNDQTSIHGWSGGKNDAPSTDFFVNTNVSSGFDNFFDDVSATKYLQDTSLHSLGVPDKYNVRSGQSQISGDRLSVPTTPYASNSDGVNRKQNESPVIKFMNDPGMDKPTRFAQMYNKFDLQRDSYNGDPIFDHPFIVRGFQNGKDTEPERWGFISTYDGGLVRGGTLTSTSRILADVERVGKFMGSGKGLMAITKFEGLYMSNPDVETHPSIPGPIGNLRNTQFYNPLSVTIQAGLNDKGQHALPFGVNPFDASPTYEDVVKERNNLSEVQIFDAIVPSSAPGDNGTQNRLLMLTKELFPTHLKTTKPPEFDFTGKVINKLSSNNGGIGSTYGIGPTTIRRAENTRAREGFYDYIFNAPTEQYNSTINKNTIPGTKNIDTNRTTRPQWEIETDYSILNRYLTFFKLDSHQTKELEEKEERQFTIYNPFSKKHLLDPNTDLSQPAQGATQKSDVELGLKNYQSLTYEKLDRRTVTDPSSTDAIRKMNDFRLDLDNSKTKGFSSDPSIINYKENNLEDRYGWGEHGKPDDGNGSVDRSDPKAETGRGDKVNLIDFKSGKAEKKEDIYGETEDLIEFYLTGTETSNTDIIVFRALLGSISDTFSPSWASQNYIGRADPVYVYQSFERSISVDFKVVATSRDEMRPIWRKLNALASYTAPEYTNVGFIKGPVMRITIGNLFQKTPCFIESLSYTVDNTSNTWEINALDEKDMLQLPKVVDVSMGLKIIGNFRPQVRGTMYSLFNTDSVGKPLGDDANFFNESEIEEVASEENYNNKFPADDKDEEGGNNP